MNNFTIAYFIIILVVVVIMWAAVQKPQEPKIIYSDPIIQEPPEQQPVKIDKNTTIVLNLNNGSAIEINPYSWEVNSTQGINGTEGADGR
jgi:hypothetical protein